MALDPTAVIEALEALLADPNRVGIQKVEVDGQTLTYKDDADIYKALNYWQSKKRAASRGGCFPGCVNTYNLKEAR